MVETQTRRRGRSGDDNASTGSSGRERDRERRAGTAANKGAARGGTAASAGQPRNATADERKFLERHRDQLSKTTLRAKWTHTPDEHEDRSGQTLATRSVDVIRKWAEDRGAVPATTASIPEGERPRTLRFDFPGGNGRNGDDARGERGGRGGGRRGLRPVSWDEWLGVFQDRDLVFLYQEHRRDGGDSNFFRLDSPKREEG